MLFLADECCPKAVVTMLRAAGHDVRYAAETDHRTDDVALLAIAQAENRIIITEDFDFGDLLIRDLRSAPGAIILFMPRSTPDDRAERLAHVMADGDFSSHGVITIIETKRVRHEKSRRHRPNIAANRGKARCSAGQTQLIMAGPPMAGSLVRSAPSSRRPAKRSSH